MLPSDPPPGRFRRVLHYFGLVNTPDDRLRSSPASTASPHPSADRPSERDAPAGARGGGPEAGNQGVRKALVYFGLAHGEPPSRYGAEVARALDDDLDALRARVAQLEARLAELDDRA